MVNVHKLVEEAVRQFNESKKEKDFHEDWIIHINEEVGKDIEDQELFEEFCWKVYEKTEQLKR